MKGTPRRVLLPRLGVFRCGPDESHLVGQIVLPSGAGCGKRGKGREMGSLPGCPNRGEPSRASSEFPP